MYDYWLGDDLAQRVLARRNRLKSRYYLARKLGYPSMEAGIMQNWSIDRINAQATKDGKLATPTDVTNEGIDSGK